MDRAMRCYREALADNPEEETARVRLDILTAAAEKQVCVCVCVFVRGQPVSLAVHKNEKFWLLHVENNAGLLFLFRPYLGSKYSVFVAINCNCPPCTPLAILHDISGCSPCIPLATLH